MSDGGAPHLTTTGRPLASFLDTCFELEDEAVVITIARISIGSIAGRKSLVSNFGDEL